MNIFRLLRRDLLYSLSYGKYKYLSLFVLTAILALSKSMVLKPIGSNCVGVIYLLLQDNGYITQLSDYQVPLYWDFYQFYILFLIGDFLSHDMAKNQPYILLRSRLKINYMLSKIAWIITQTILIYVLLFAIIYIVSSLVLGTFSIGDSRYFTQTIQPTMQIHLSPEKLLIRILIGFILSGVVLSGIQLLAMQVITPMMGFLGVVILCTISTFSGLKWLPAIHSMILKQDIFNLEHHLTFTFSLWYCLITYSVVSFLSILIIKKKDIY